MPPPTTPSEPRLPASLEAAVGRRSRPLRARTSWPASSCTGPGGPALDASGLRIDEARLWALRPQRRLAGRTGADRRGARRAEPRERGDPRRVADAGAGVGRAPDRSPVGRDPDPRHRLAQRRRRPVGVSPVGAGASHVRLVQPAGGRLHRGELQLGAVPRLRPDRGRVLEGAVRRTPSCGAAGSRRSRGSRAWRARRWSSTRCWGWPRSWRTRSASTCSTTDATTSAASHARTAASLPGGLRFSCGGPAARRTSAATRAAWSNDHQWELTWGG